MRSKVSLLIYIIKQNIGFSILIFSLLMWAITTSILALANKKEIMLIAIDDDGTRLLTRLDDPILKSERVNFLKYFISSLYNFTPDSFNDSVGAAADLMSQNLWRNEEQKIKRLQENVVEKKIYSRARITKIIKDDEFYEVYLNSHIKKKLSEKTSKIIAKIKLLNVERTDLNPWGMEVESIDEKRVTDNSNN